MNALRSRIDHGFAAFGRLVYRRRFSALLLTLGLALALVAQLPKLTADNSTEGFFHDDDPNLITYNAFREQFGRDEIAIALITPETIYDPAFLETLRAFHAALEAEVPYLREVRSLANVRDTRGEGDTLVVERLLETVPRAAPAMAAFRAKVQASRLYPNLYVAEDGSATTVLLETVAYSPAAESGDLLGGFGDALGTTPGSGTANSGTTPGSGTAGDGAGDGAFTPLSEAENAAVVAALQTVAARFDGPDFPIHLTGAPVITEFFNVAIARDVGTFMSLAFVAFGVFLLVLFRRFSGALLPLAVVALSLLATVGLIALSGEPFTNVTSILPSFMMSVGVGSAVHVLAIFYRRYQQCGDKEEAVVHTFAHSGLPIVMTGLTTAAGLFSFAGANMAPVANLGRFGGIGVLVILLFTLVLMPALIAVLPLRPRPRFVRGQPGARMDRLLVGIADFATGRPWTIVLLAVLIVIGAGSGLAFQGFGHHFTRWLPQGGAMRTALELMNDKLRGAGVLEIVVDTGRENGLYEPAVLQRLQTLSRRAEEYRTPVGQQLVGKTTSILNVLQETHQALNENRPAFYRIPDSRALIAQELLLFENSGSDDLQRLVDSRFSQARLTARVLDLDAHEHVAFVQEMEAEAAALFAGHAQVTVTGTVRLWTQTVGLLMRSMAESYLIAGVVITVLMMVMLGSVRMGLLSMIPNLAPILLTLGVMGWLGIRLDMSNMLLGTVAIGLAVDDTIHFFHNFRSDYTRTGDPRQAVRETMLSTGRAMVFTTLVLTTGFALFLFASLLNLVEFGLLVAITLVLALLADILLAPAMMVLLTRTRHGARVLERWGSAPTAATATTGTVQPAPAPAE